MLNTLQKITTVLLLLILAGCQTLTSDKKWPTELPARKIFVDSFLDSRGLDQDLKSKHTNAVEAHLSWIVRFYQGTLLYPNGWNQVSERFLASIKSQKSKELMEVRLRSLGILIANEWAQDNDVRKINSSNVATWGSALRTSAERNDQENYISQVENDVNALIKGAVTSTDISYERYYPADDYDDF